MSDRAGRRWPTGAVAVGVGVLVAGVIVSRALGGDDVEQDDGPVAAGPAREGSYRYVVTKTRTVPGGEPDKLTSRVTLQVRTTSRASGDVRQTMNSGEESAEVAWRPDGQYLVSDTDEELPEECRWEPPVLRYRLPMRAGTSWTVESTCMSGPIKVQRSERARVTGKQRVEVGNVDVEVWVVERNGQTKYSTDEGGGQSIERDTTATDLFAAHLGLVVRSKVGTTTKTPDGAGLARITELELQGVRPADKLF